MSLYIAQHFILGVNQSAIHFTRWQTCWMIMPVKRYFSG